MPKEISLAWAVVLIAVFFVYRGWRNTQNQKNSPWLWAVFHCLIAICAAVAVNAVYKAVQTLWKYYV